MTKICKALKLASPSANWQSVTLLNEGGNYIATLQVINADDPQGIADQVVAALNAQASREGDQS